VVGVVAAWHCDRGWGVLRSAAVDGDVWAHFSNIDATGYRSLEVGETVTFTYETPGQDGYPHRARRVKRGHQAFINPDDPS
jgi:CspA family cold shock protein